MLAALKTAFRPAARLVLRAAGQAPVNLRGRETSANAIARDVDYALSIGLQYRDLLATHGVCPRGHRLLELGPGYHFGAVMVLACYGAIPAVADRFLVPWEPAYHPAFYTRLRDELVTRHKKEAAGFGSGSGPGSGLGPGPGSGSGSAFDPAPLNRLIAASHHAPDIIPSYNRSAEELDEVPTASVDVVLSNAVLEHLADPARAFAQLYRLTKPGGLHLHQVDFRDHRDFTRPLDYLLMDRAAFEVLFAERHGECGRQIRPQEMEVLFRKVGFDVLAYHSNIEADSAYLVDFMLQLQATSHSPYAAWTRGELGSISGRFHLQKPADGRTETGPSRATVAG